MVSRVEIGGSSGCKGLQKGSLIGHRDKVSGATAAIPDRYVNWTGVSTRVLGNQICLSLSNG